MAQKHNFNQLNVIILTDSGSESQTQAPIGVKP